MVRETATLLREINASWGKAWKVTQLNDKDFSFCEDTMYLLVWCAERERSKEISSQIQLDASFYGNKFLQSFLFVGINNIDNTEQREFNPGLNSILSTFCREKNESPNQILDIHYTILLPCNLVSRTLAVQSKKKT